MAEAVDKVWVYAIICHIVTCMLFIYFVYLVSVDPDIGEIDGK